MFFILWNVLGGILFVLSILFTFRLLLGSGYEQAEEEVEPFRRDIA